ncbi:enoyl-CoA-hydratase DpgB [Actinomadura rupiterrae]|uniref:enoyl-CoA-hydratase DpgB n=1 Tax=Actinomadura rupiterrae TaxID=559627 RepID=UPI0020A499EF|nr:enoyl-CoA-hydratase DpgB [Actinomadura rupiterrae]MCP2343576.1 isomerase DpgB [Actinomadura rupiterrae]
MTETDVMKGDAMRDFEVFDDLELHVDGSRPFDADAVAAAVAVCDRAEDHHGPGVVLVHVSGAPEPGWTDALDLPTVNRWERTLRRLERLPMTTVAVAAGDCGGAALDALLVTDRRLARPGTRLLVPSDRSTTWPGMATFRLVNQVGAARVRRAVLFGEPITADQALGLGLLDQVTDDPGAALAELAGRDGAYSGPDLSIRRQLMFDAATTSYEDALGAHLAACDRELRRTAGVRP